MSRRLRGFGLIEVLVSLVVISVGLLGAVALFGRAQQAEMESYQRAQALILVEDLVNRLNANRSAAACYEITTDPAGGQPYAGVGGTADLSCAGAGTTATRATADADLLAWDGLLKGASETFNGANAGGIVAARGCVSANAAGDVYTITVAWQGVSSSAAPSAPCASGQYGDDDRLRRTVSRTVRFADLD